MRSTRILFLAVAFLAASPGDAAGADGWMSLFDGTLAGWSVAARPADAGQNFWSVQDGAITCDSRGRGRHGYVWLLREGEFGDFQLKLKVRSFRESAGNSGVQVRSRYDWQSYWLDGPQVDVNPPGPYRNGLLYDETRGVRHWIFPLLAGSQIAAGQGVRDPVWRHSDEGDGWNELHIECRGTRIKTMVNGAPVADYDGAGLLDDELHRARGVGMQGSIALQLHTGDELYIQYKDILIRPLAGK